MRLFIVSEEPHLSTAIGRQLRSAGVAIEVVGVDPRTHQVGEVLVNQGQFDVMIVCHSRYRDLFVAAAAVRPRMGLVLYSTHRVMDGCPPGTVWLEKPATDQDLLTAIGRAMPQPIRA